MGSSKKHKLAPQHPKCISTINILSLNLIAGLLEIDKLSLGM